MTIAIWIIAICSIIRIVQNETHLKQNKFHLSEMVRNRGARENAYAEFVKSLKMTDREFVKRMLEEFEENINETT